MSNATASAESAAADSGTITKQQWKWSFLAGMASYLDAGSIVAQGVSYGAFEKEFGLSKGTIGLLGAIGPNAIGCAIGAFIGGRLGDKLGRKRIYQYDLLVYAFGILLMGCAVNSAMLFIGTLIVGLAVGADVPTSLALVGEFAPAKARGKLLGLTQIAWCLGPSIVLWLAVAVAGLEMWGIRIIFFHLVLVALITWAMRRGLSESARWKAASGSARQHVKALFSGPNLRALIWTTVIYTFWNIPAGTAGNFFPYFLRSLNVASPAASTGVYSIAFVSAMLTAWLVFMPYADRSFRVRKWLWGIGAVAQIVAWGMLLFLPFNLVTSIANIVLFASGGALAGEAFYKVFSQELFPTMLRGTAQGISFGIARLLVGIWALLVPTVAENDIRPIALILTICLVISGTVGFFGMPDTSGKSLEQIESERGTA